MRFMLLLKAGPKSESETSPMPDEKLLNEMGRFNEEMVKSGVMLSGEGLHPTRDGARVRFSGGKPAVVLGPFKDGNLVAGFWLIKVKSKQEAIDWASKVPDPGVADGGNWEIELRQVYELEDFPQDNESIKKEKKFREDSAKKK